MIDPLRLEFAARTDVGPRRNYNEDAAAVFTPRGLHSRTDAFAGALPADDGVVLVVLDGMGGASTGYMACERAIACLADELARAWPEHPDERLSWFGEIIKRASIRVKGDDPMYAGQGATIAMAVVVGSVVHLLHVGDVRAYLVRGERLEQRTRDDSLINDARDHGLTAAELAQVPRNIVTQALGHGEPQPHVQELRLEPGDGLLLCSDGLHDPLTDAEIEATLRGRDPAAACEALIQRAIAADSSDNITALFARLGPASERSDADRCE
jgi:serine/threonine protein phosphatase PrpC